MIKQPLLCVLVMTNLLVSGQTIIQDGLAAETKYDGSLDGTWEVTAFSRDGKEVPGGALREALIIKAVDDNRLSFHFLSSVGADSEIKHVVDGKSHKDENNNSRQYKHWWTDIDKILHYEVYDNGKKIDSGCYYRIGKDILVRYDLLRSGGKRENRIWKYKLIDEIPWDMEKVKARSKKTNSSTSESSHSKS